MALRRILIVAVLSLLVASASAALEVSCGAEADVVSDYVWRAMVFSPGFVLEPYAYVSAFGVTPAVWANVQLQDEHNTLDEIDFLISYNRSFASLYVEAGYVYYYLPEYKYEEPEGGENPQVVTTDPTDTQDLFVVLDYAVLPVLNVYSDHYVTVAGNAGGYYFDAGVGLGHAVEDYLGLEAYCEAGVGSSNFNDYNMGEHKTALNLIETGAAATFAFGGGMYLRPHLSYTTLVDGDLREAAGEGNESFWFGGAAIGIER
ncbi:MAG: hypothetical protein JSU81_11470 [Candidatus Coatesbacteria bacterium]|nr:MAG: hypothetical protein JSU81_11470 [Candidatus Coatesbacteria bacterium]